MRTRFWLPALIVLIGLPVFVALIVSGRRGQSEVEAVREVQWPAALSTLPAQVNDLTVDEGGVLWFPILVPPNGEGKQVNLLYRSNPVSGAVQTFQLPADEGSTFVARVEAGIGARKGVILVAWESTLLEVDSATGQVNRLNVAIDPAKVVSGPEPATTRIYDIAVDKDGTVWVSRDHYPYLMAVYVDGSSKVFALPKEAGSPERLAVDGEGRIWATLIRHQPVSFGPDAAVNAYRFTLRFDPKAAKFDVLPIAVYNIAGSGAMVVGMAGDQPAPVQRLDTADSKPVALTDYGPTIPGDEMAASANGDVWFRSRSVPGLVDVVGSGRVVAFPLPVYTSSLENTLGGETICVPNGPNDPACDPNNRVASTLHTPVLAIAAAPDGSAWFSTGDTIGHAVP